MIIATPAPIKKARVLITVKGEMSEKDPILPATKVSPIKVRPRVSRPVLERLSRRN